MTMREFWHDIRERLTEDRSPRREWRGERDPSSAQRRERESVGERRRSEDEGWRGERAFTDPNRSRAAAYRWEGQRYMDRAGGFTSAAYDPQPYTGRTWSADERSADWRERAVDDYGQYAVGYTQMGWPDRYAATLYGVSYRGRGPQNWHRADERIREEICELMTEDEDLDPSEIEVLVKDGEVTLSGIVESRRDKCHAERLAERVSGVHDVHNRLNVQRARDTFLGTRQALSGSSIGTQTRQ